MATPAFFYDAEDELVIAKFPEDFADFLSDVGYEPDAQDFMSRWKLIETTTPNDELKFHQVVSLAEEYAPIVEVGDETRRPTSKTFEQVFNLLRDLEQSDDIESDDDAIPWDREGALVNRFISDMPHEAIVEAAEDDGPEFPDVKLYVSTDDPLPKIVLDTVVALGQGGYPDVASDLVTELKYEFARGGDRFRAVDILTVLCSYIDIRVKDHSFV